MLMWESTLAVRDSVFTQIALLTALAYVAYKLFFTQRQTLRITAQSIGLGLLLALFVVSVANIILWSPA